jgi:CRISPR-associated protein Cas5t
MQALKIVLEGVTTSFRYPHFMLGVQPGFPLPPPATIYGHVCSALGEWFDPEGVAFAYHFTVAGEGYDLEHIHVLSASSGKLPGGERKALEGNINPFKRQISAVPAVDALPQPARMDRCLPSPALPGCARSLARPGVLHSDRDC